MANTAINHDPVATFPGSSTNTAVVKWSGTSGNALLDSGVIIDGSNNVTGLNNVTATGYLHLTGDEKELRFYEGANYIAIAAPSGLGADYTFTLPLNDGAADEFLQTNGSGVLTWAAAAGTTINSNADNRVITGSGTANTLNGESNLTYTGTELVLTGTGISSIERQTSGTNSISAPVHIRNKTSNDAADGFGPVINFQMTDTGVTDQQMGYIGFERHGADNSARFLVNVMNAGSLVEGLLMDNTGNVTVSTGNVVIGTAGKGIDFSATTNASGTGVTMSNELFDDYEEGTWTPTLLDQDLNSNMSQTYGVRQGSYVKIGEVVFVWAIINITGRGSMETSDRAHIGGLPFTPVSTPTDLNGPFIFHSATGMNFTAGNVPSGRISPGNTYVYLANWDVSGGTSNLLISELSDDCGFTMSGYYR
mgnify:CR=1 FL=1